MRLMDNTMDTVRRCAALGLLLILLIYGSGCTRDYLRREVPSMPEAPNIVFYDTDDGLTCLDDEEMKGLIRYVLELERILEKAIVDLKERP